jgi:hypothetical protein
VLPIHIHPGLATWIFPYVSRNCPDYLLDRRHAPLLLARRCIPHDILHPSWHPPCPRDHVRTLDRMALARSSRLAPPSRHLRKRSSPRFEVHGCREVDLVLLALITSGLSVDVKNVDASWKS